jgi:uncharacterized protein YndB with AHSA1/START domain
MQRDLRLEKIYPHPIQRVWAALTDPRALATWLMENDFQPMLGHRFTFRARPQPGWDGFTYCEVTELEPPRCLAFTWRGGAGKGRPPTLDTTVRFTLEAVQEGTRLVFEQRGFAGYKGFLLSFMLGSGWKKMLNRKLPQVLEGLAAGQKPTGLASCDHAPAPL